MLEALRIRNFAVLEDVVWEPGRGMNAVTGETGAGKSILIDALLLLLGERADKGAIRAGAEQAVVEAVFEFGPGRDGVLEELGLEASGEGKLFLKRAVSVTGSKQWVNGSPATLQCLRRLGEELVDFHGPHDHQSLLKVEAQRAALDGFAGLEITERLGVYREVYRSWREAEMELAGLKEGGVGHGAARVEFLDHQIGEIEAARLRVGEEEEVEAAYRAAAGARRILEIGSGLRGLLEEGPGDVLGQLAQVQRGLGEWARLDCRAGALAELNEGAIAQVKELVAAIEEQVERVELDQERLGELEARLHLFEELKRKYGPTLAAVLEKLDTMREERERLVSREGRVVTLEREVVARREAVMAEGKKVSAVRRGAAPGLGEAIAAQLRELGFRKAGFEVRVETGGEPGPEGLDRVEFFFAPNPGEAVKPLRAIASSGEMARVMLAVKTVLAAGDRVPVLIFDEVDANVGGETAVVVGKKLRGLGAGHQVFCITHLPQVAAAAHCHYRVEKEVKGGRTFAVVERVEGEARVDELARMLGGKREAGRKLARELVFAAGGAI